MRIKQKPDIISVFETWLNSDMFDFDVTITGFIIDRTDRFHDERDGGVPLSVKNSLYPRQSFFPVLSNSSDFDAVGCQLAVYDSLLNVFCVYRSPRCSGGDGRALLDSSRRFGGLQGA